MAGSRRIPPRAGVRLRFAHLAEVMTAVGPWPSWLELNAYDFLGRRRAATLLGPLAERYPLSVDVAGIGIVEALDPVFLRQLAQLVDTIDAGHVSGALEWRAQQPSPGRNRLTPPGDCDAPALLERRVAEIQEHLRHPLIIRVPIGASICSAANMTEVEFITGLVRRTGCRLLIDISDVCSQIGDPRLDAIDWLARVPTDVIAQLRLGGCAGADTSDPAGAMVLEGNRGGPVSASAWRWYVKFLKRFGPRPTSIVWQDSPPVFGFLAQEAVFADALADSVTRLTSHTVH